MIVPGDGHRLDRVDETGRGVELFSAWFAGEAYQKHRHHTYAVGVTDAGVQVFDYRGVTHVRTPGHVIVLYPDEVHDGRAGGASSPPC